MNLQKIKDVWKVAIVKLAEYGVPVPILRDPFNQRASLPFTMMILSIALVVIGIVGKLSAIVGGMSQGSALQFLTTSAALYFGHSMVTSSTTDPNGKTQKTELKTGNEDKGQ